MAHRIFTSESVTEGHPDKVCDQISDAVLDAILAQDPMGRVACECIATTGMVLVMGEMTHQGLCGHRPPSPAQVIRDIGYTNPAYGFDGRHLRRPHRPSTTRARTSPWASTAPMRTAATPAPAIRA